MSSPDGEMVDRLAKARDEYGRALRDARMVAIGFMAAGGDRDAALAAYEALLDRAYGALEDVVEMVEALESLERATPSELGLALSNAADDESLSR